MNSEPKPAQPSNYSLAKKRWHASRTPEQREAWRRNVSIGTSVGMDEWNARRTEADKEHARQARTDTAVCQMWIPHGPRPGALSRGKNKVDPNTPVGGTTLAKIEKASVKRILKDLVGTQPDLIKEAMIAGLLAPPPRSFPYIALAAAYLDGKPVDAEPVPCTPEDLSNLTRDELMQRALSIATRLRDDAHARADMERESAERAAARGLPIIEATVIPQKENQ
jgi:hypothetical protein